MSVNTTKLRQQGKNKPYWLAINKIFSVNRTNRKNKNKIN